jgi:ABC-type dipeptide/oligopeptide/nickel transport system ATPase component
MAWSTYVIHDAVNVASPLPATVGLLGSAPGRDAPEGARLVPIPVAPPSLAAPPPGCPFRAALSAGRRRLPRASNARARISLARMKPS